MNHHDDIDTMAGAIVARHQAQLGLPLSEAAAPAPAFDEPVYRAALRACTALGFSPADALCVAAAWRRQVLRLGRFDAADWPSAAIDFELPAIGPVRGVA
jgi:thiamine-phosphate pyrophosphorylase